MAGFHLHKFNSYRITLKDHLRVGKYAILIVMAYFIFSLFLIISNVPQYEIFLGSFLIVVVVFIMPGVLLHINYANSNNKYELHEYYDKLIIYNFGVLVREINHSNIKSIQVNMSPNAIRDAGTRLTCEEYNYLTFYTDQGPVNVSNLIYPDIKNLAHKFEGIQPQYRRTIFAWIK
jgi:hypothetical protein